MIKKILQTIFKPETVYAHCDVPCGIYDPSSAQIAAKTVKTMVTKILDLKKPEDAYNIEYLNTVNRMVATKEEHAQICKEQILILWTDYFKPENIANFPNIHETFWKAAKLCTKAKQSVSLQVAEDLVSIVSEIAQMFNKAEEAKKLA